MTGRRGVVLVVAGFLAVSAPAGAQWWTTPKIYCQVGATNCMGAHFTFAPNPDPLGGTLFSAFLQNLQGSFGSTTTQTSIKRFVLERLNSPTAPNGVVFRSDPGLATPLPRIELGHFPVGDSTISVYRDTYAGNPTPVVDYAGYDWGGLTGLVGCRAYYQESEPNVRVGMFHYRTCPRQGLDGWLRLDFVLDTWNYATFSFENNSALTFNDFAFSVFTEETFSPGYGWTSCTFGNIGGGMPERGTDCNVFEYHLPTVTPEPSTLILLGGTLPIALGFIRARRRRR